MEAEKLGGEGITEVLQPADDFQGQLSTGRALLQSLEQTVQELLLLEGEHGQRLQHMTFVGRADRRRRHLRHGQTKVIQRAFLIDIAALPFEQHLG